VLKFTSHRRIETNILCNERALRLVAVIRVVREPCMQSIQQPLRPSPLDDALSQLLALLESGANTPSTIKDMNDIAETMDVPPAFVQGLFLSARRRGLVRPESVGRGRTVWKVTRSGSALLSQHSDRAATFLPIQST
jgi:hypothetical protein